MGYEKAKDDEKEYDDWDFAKDWYKPYYWKAEVIDYCDCWVDYFKPWYYWSYRDNYWDYDCYCWVYDYQPWYYWYSPATIYHDFYGYYYDVAYTKIYDWVHDYFPFFFGDY